MPAYINATGTEYLELTNDVAIGASDDFCLELYFLWRALGWQTILGSTSSSNSYIRFYSGGNGLRVRTSGSNDFSFTSVLVDDTEYTFKIKRVGGVLDITDENDVSIVSSTTSDTRNFIIRGFLTFTNADQRWKGGLFSCKLDVNNVTIHDWNADASDRSNTGEQPVLVDTVGGNHANGYNFPTDGSAWESTGGGVTRLSRDISLVTGFSQRLAHDTTINTAMLDRKPSDTTISTALLERKSNDTQIHTGLLTRLTQNTEIEFSLLSRLSRTTQIHTALFERKSRDYDVAFSLLERKIKNTNIVTGILNRLSNDIAIVTGMLGAKSRDYTISFALLERQQNSVAIQFSIEGDKVPRVQLTPKAIPAVQLAYLADETQVIQITPITPTKIQLQ